MRRRRRRHRVPDGTKPRSRAELEYLAKPWVPQPRHEVNRRNEEPERLTALSGPHTNDRRSPRCGDGGYDPATLRVEEHAEVRAFGVDVVVIERTDADGVRTLSAHRLAAR